MPASPSMNVIALRQAAVFRNAGSYATSPFRSVARIAPSTIGTVYSSPVRLSTIDSESSATAASVSGRRAVAERLVEDAVDQRLAEADPGAHLHCPREPASHLAAHHRAAPEEARLPCIDDLLGLGLRRRLVAGRIER